MATNDLELRQLTRPAGVGKYEWDPFEVDDGFTHQWWHRPWLNLERYSPWAAYADGAEVARIELDYEVNYDHYQDVPPMGRPVLEIDFLEVKATKRGSGIGRRVLGLLAQCFSRSSTARLQRGSRRLLGRPRVGPL